MDVSRQVLKDHGKQAAILEFKVFDQIDDETCLEDTAENALKQIEDKHYEAELLARGIPKENILKYGFGFPRQGMPDPECAE